MRIVIVVIGLQVAAGCSRGVAPPEPFTFAVLGDRTSEPDPGAWERIVAAVAARGPDLVLTVGDLADDATDPFDWDRALAPTSRLPMPIRFVPGNHDIHDEATEANFTERTGQAPYGAFEAGGIRFVVVDTSRADRWEELTEAQRAWLEEELSRRTGTPTVALMHKPFWALGAAIGEPDPMHDLFVRSGVRAVFTGHWHNHAHQEIDGISYTIAGTSGGAWIGLQDPALGNAFQYLWVEVRDGGMVTTRVVDGVDHPVERPTLADYRRLRELARGASVATLHEDGRLVLAIPNASEAPLETVLHLDPGAWEGDTLSVPVRVPPGGIFEHTILLGRGEHTFPLPRARFDTFLPDSGLVSYTATVDHPRTIRVPRAAAPTLDGILSPEEWSGSARIDALGTGRGLPATTEPTTVLLRHDGESLYFAADCRQQADLKAMHRGRDGQIVYDDRIGLLLSPHPDHIYWFYVNPNGAVWDLHADRGAGQVHRDWDGVEARAGVDDGGWTVEARIPFAAMGAGIPPAEWGFDLRRKQERAGTEAVFTPGFWTTSPARIGRMRLDGVGTE